MKALPLQPELSEDESEGECNERWERSAYRELAGEYWQYLAAKVANVFPEPLQGLDGFEAARGASTRFALKGNARTIRRRKVERHSLHSATAT